MKMYKALLAGAALCAAFGISACSNEDTATATDLPREALVQQGQYLVSIMACTDCHTPGHFLGKPDMARFLGGSDVGFEIPGLGVFYGPNLTPDTETGLGTWDEGQIVTALTKGELPDGRILAPAMPWHSYVNLKPEDARAIAVYLKSLTPISNEVAGPYGQSETPAGAFHRIIVPAASQP